MKYIHYFIEVFLANGDDTPPSPTRSSIRRLDKITITKFRTQTCYPIAGYDAPLRHRLSQNTNGVLSMKSATRSAGSPFLTSDEGPFKFVTGGLAKRSFDRSEEHTSELQSLMRNSSAVFC